MSACALAGFPATRRLGGIVSFLGGFLFVYGLGELIAFAVRH